MAMGGYREGSGRSKFGYYKGIYCGSTYELCWVIYNLDHNIPFKRFDTFITDGIVKYYPDFLLDDKTIVEIKGYYTPQVDAKTKLAESKGYKVKVLYKEDLQYAFDYVKIKYKIPCKTKFHTLYDTHKPKYHLTCNYCQKMYNTDAKPRKNITFCSRVCSGKYRFASNTSDPVIKKKMDSSPPPVIRKLTDEQVKEIFTAQEPYARIAERYQINKSMVSHIKDKRVYKQLTKDL